MNTTRCSPTPPHRPLRKHLLANGWGKCYKGYEQVHYSKQMSLSCFSPQKREAEDKRSLNTLWKRGSRNWTEREWMNLWVTWSLPLFYLGTYKQWWETLLVGRGLPLCLWFPGATVISVTFVHKLFILFSENTLKAATLIDLYYSGKGRLRTGVDTWGINLNETRLRAC